MDTQRKFLLGTGRKLDYLIIVNRGGAALAVKPVVTSAMKYGSLLCLRVRVALMPSAPQSLKAAGCDWPTVFPELKWEKNDAERASSMLMVPTGVMPFMYDEVRDRMSSSAEVLMDKLEVLFNDIDHPKDDIQAFIIDHWKQAVDWLEQHLPSKPEVIPDAPVVHLATDLFESEKEIQPANGVFKGVAPKSTGGTDKPKPKFGVIEGGLSGGTGGGDFGDKPVNKGHIAPVNNEDCPA